MSLKLSLKFSRQLVLALTLLFALTACDEQTSFTPSGLTATSVVTPNPVSTITTPPTPEATTVAVTSQPAITVAPTPATVTVEGGNDEVGTALPAITINPNQTFKPPAPTVIEATPTPTFNFGTLTTPPPTLAATGAITGTALHNAFVIATSEGLFWLTADGKTERQIVSGARFSQPKIAPDGSRIAAMRDDPITRKVRLFLINLADGTLQPAFDQDNLLTSSVAWSPDSKTLAVTRVVDNNGDGNANSSDNPSIWLYSLDNHKLKEIGPGRDAIWSPDGARLAYIIPAPIGAQLDPATHQLTLSANNIAIYNPQQEAKRTLTGSDVPAFALKDASSDKTLVGQKATLRYFKQLNWSPDSKLIGVSADGITADGRRVGLILTLTSDNPTLQLLTSGNQAAGNFSWSPDGKKLAFEGLPQFPFTSQSSRNVALVTLPDKAGPAAPQTLIGAAIDRTETTQPRWIMGGQTLAFIQGDFASLGLSNNDGSQVHLLVSGCLGFDWLP